jgi:uncharacterized membrane protein
MLIENISAIGWLHSIASVIALAAGAWNLALRKGTAIHRLVGRTYFYTMIVVNLSVFAIYHFDIAHFRPFVAGPNTFGLFHREAVATLLVLFLGVYAAPRQQRALWAYVHPLSMLTTYYMLIGGLINEAFVRLDVLRAVVRAQAHGSTGFFATPAVGLAQSGAMLLFIVLALYFVIKVALYRRGIHRGAATASLA